MINAYSGDDEESRMKLQQLQVQLEEAEEELSDTEYQRRLDDQQRIFDHLYQNLEETFNSLLENPEKLIAETEELVNENLPEIKKTLKENLETYNTTISQSLNNILGEDGIQSVNSNIAMVDGDIKAITSSVTDQTKQLEEYYKNYGIEEKTRKDLLGRAQVLFSATEDGSFQSNFNLFNEKLQNIYNAINGADRTARWMNTANGVGQAVGNAIGTAANVSTVTKLATDIVSNLDIFGTKKVTSLNPFFGKHAKGVKKLSADELAWTQENGLEAILRPTDNAILTPLKAGDSVLTAEATKNLWDFANNPLAFMKSTVGTPTMVSKGNGVTFNNSMSPTIVVNGVSNVSQFLQELQKNKQFESMMQDMTVNLMNGGSSLAKLKYKY